MQRCVSALHLIESVSLMLFRVKKLLNEVTAAWMKLTIGCDAGAGMLAATCLTRTLHYK